MEDDATDQKLKATAAITILLLGDAGCGKSTFLSRLKKKKSPRDNLELEEPLQLLADCNQPFIYEVRFSRKESTLKLELEFYDTASPDRHWSTLQPDVVLLAFDVSDRSRDALAGLKGWRNDITRYFQRGSGECIPVMLIGFKRDLRVEDEGVIYPQEAYRIAQELHCDRYAECSATTGELMAEAFEDIATLAAKTVTENEARQEGGDSGGCVIF
ncbi:P-loop containing nucleoside triphosphate hydrolase protein [Elaphomyces granulatus]